MNDMFVFENSQKIKLLVFININVNNEIEIETQKKTRKRAYYIPVGHFSTHESQVITHLI